jgi:uncharacterized membrane protein
MKKFFLENYLLIGILTLAAILRLYHLEFQGAWLDELHTLKEGDPNLTFKELHDVIMFREGIPHFYFIMIRIFGVIFSHSIFSIRLFSAICGILAVFGIYLLGKEMRNKNLGYISAFFLAIHPFHIEHSQDGRSYSLLVLFVILAFFRLVLFVKQTSIKNAIYLGIFLGLITNAHPIGIVNVLSVYLILIIYFFTLVKKEDRNIFIKYTLLSGIFTLIVFLPVYQIVAKVSEIQSFWVQKPSFEYVTQVLTTLSGGGKTVFYSILVCILFIFLSFLKNFKTEKDTEKQNFINTLIIFVWITFFFFFLLLKSQGEASLILGRYLISLVPGSILAISYTASLIKYKHFKSLVVVLISFMLIYTLLIEKNYYTTRTKSQFNDISLKIIELNPNNETIISKWGWLLTFYLDRENTSKNVLENNLDDYLNDVKTNSVSQENFWYVDGNSRPYLVTSETQAFLDENYFLEKTIDLHDCWAKHFISKKELDSNEITVKLNRFNNAQYNGSGNLMFFENSKSSLPIFLNKGKYSLEISSLSYPQSKIENENSKFKVYINSKLEGTFEASEDKIKINEINFEIVSDEKILLQIEFINDYSKDDLDRNLEIKKIRINRK